MSIQSIKINNYKSIKNLKLNLSNKKMIGLIGVNNVGKTNILEAIDGVKNVNRHNDYRNDMNFSVVNFNNSYARNKVDSNLKFEIEYLFACKDGEERISIKNYEKNENSWIKNKVDNVITKYEKILEEHFKDKYILQNNFISFKEELKNILVTPLNNRFKNFNPNFPSSIFDNIDQNIDDLKTRVNSFLEKNYVFSESDVEKITSQILNFAKEFEEIKTIFESFDFSKKIFYISSSFDNPFLFEVFQFDQEKKILQLKNNCFSALVYNNENYETILQEINNLLVSQDSLTDDQIGKVNQKLKKEFLMCILNPNGQDNNDDSYAIYPKFFLKDNSLKSTLIVNKRFKFKNEIKEYDEDISLISEGLKNKLVLKLNLDYCKKYKDQEIILLFDEPDKSLHITAILELYKEFEKITNTTKTKIIYTTHSPYLLGNIFANHSNILVVEKNENNETIIGKYSQNKITELSDTAIGKMAAITGNDFLIINALNSNYQYVTVEGKTDYEFYTWFNKNYIENNRLLFVPINSKYKSELINLLNKLNLSYISLYDNDVIEDNFWEKIDKKRSVKYSDIPDFEAINELETLLEIRKKEHSKVIKTGDFNKIDSFYKDVLKKKDVQSNVEKVFSKLQEKLGELYG